MKEKFKKFFSFLCNPRLLLCFGIAWIITNGWSYILFGIGTYFKIGWMVTVSATYIAFLWLPVTPEKIFTVIIAIALMKLLFPKDEKTLGVLENAYRKFKNHSKEKRAEKKQKKAAAKGTVLSCDETKSNAEDKSVTDENTEPNQEEKATVAYMEENSPTDSDESEKADKENIVDRLTTTKTQQKINPII